MKNRLVQIILLTVFSSSAFSQTDCKHYVSTDPDNPSNLNSLPLFANGSQNDQYLNGFDWFPIGAPGTPDEGLYLGYNLTNMNFAGTPLPIMSNIMSNQGTLPYYNYIFNGPLPLTENGWELLLVNTGRFADDITDIPISSADLHAFPYIVIYNRYLGKIRVFCKFGLDQTVHAAADAVEISILFSNIDEYSGLMRLYDGMDRPLDVNTDNFKMTSIAKAQNFGNKWYSTDFQIAYDPCTCFYKSEIQLVFSQIKKSTLTAHSRTITLEDQSLIDNSSLTVNPSDWLSGFDYSGTTANGGIAIAKSLDLMTSRYIAELEEYKQEFAATQAANAEVERRLAIIKLFENVVVQGGGSAIVSLVNLPFWGKVDTFAHDLIGFDVIDSASLVKLGKKYLGQGVTGLKTMIAGEMKPLPQKPEVPVATFSETSYSGQILQHSDYAGPVFYTPGTYGSQGTGKPTLTSVYYYPIYNEVLGSFALLKKPKIRITKFIFDEEDELFQETTQNYLGLHRIKLQRYQSWSKSYNISLSEKLEFAFNDVLDIKDYTVSASFVVKAKRKPLNIPSSSRIAAFHDHEKFVNTSVTNDNINNYGPIYSYGQSYHHFSDNPELNEVNWYSNPDVTLSKTTFDFDTPYIPLDAMMPFDASFAIKNEAVSFKVKDYTDFELEGIDNTTNSIGQVSWDLENQGILKPFYHNPAQNGFEYVFEVELKLFVEIEFNTLNSSGKPNVVTEIHSFKVDPSWITNVEINGALWSQFKPNDITHNIQKT